MAFHYYFRIFDQPVYIPWGDGRSMTEAALPDKDVSWLMSGNINSPHGHKVRREAHKIQRKWLAGEFGRDPNSFRKRWVEFDFVDEAAQDNAFRILDSFVVHQKLVNYVVFRSLDDADVVCLDRWPIGRRFALAIRFSWTDRYAEFQIKVQEVQSVKGNLDSLVTFMQSCLLRLSGTSISREPLPL